MGAVKPTTMIALTEARAAVEGMPEGAPLEDRLRVAMSKTHHHWMCFDEEEQFKAAVGALLVTGTPEERESLEAEMRSLRDLSAVLQGIPVDLERIVPPAEESERFVGLLRLWGEGK